MYLLRNNSMCGFYCGLHNGLYCIVSRRPEAVCVDVSLSFGNSRGYKINLLLARFVCRYTQEGKLVASSKQHYVKRKFNSGINFQIKQTIFGHFFGGIGKISSRTLEIYLQQSDADLTVAAEIGRGLSKPYISGKHSYGK